MCKVDLLVMIARSGVDVRTNEILRKDLWRFYLNTRKRSLTAIVEQNLENLS